MDIEILFYFVRHGRTANNGKNLYRGVSNNSDSQLSPAGKDDIRQAGLWLKKYGPHFPIIIVDDLSRTQETAQILASILGIKEIITDKRMRPLDVGEFTGEPKDKHPLEEYFKDRSKKIPGGQSMDQFDKIQASVFGNIFDTSTKMKLPVLVVGHGSNVSFLVNSVRKHTKQEPVGYEGLVNPGGVLMFTTAGIFPLTNLREGSATIKPDKDGTALTGFVTEEENRPPRECWNCKAYTHGISGGECQHPLVKIDPQLQDRKLDNGNIAVKDRECCDHFRNKVAS